MGQPITVTMRAGTRPEMRFFEANRSITGMAIETYPSADEATGDRPPDVLARRLLRPRRHEGHGVLQRRDRRGAGVGVA